MGPGPSSRTASASAITIAQQGVQGDSLLSSDIAPFRPGPVRSRRVLGPSHVCMYVCTYSTYQSVVNAPSITISVIRTLRVQTPTSASAFVLLYCIQLRVPDT
ncbi:hypothetical protein L209DRAFT_753333 [Thermothelomyces heterothallicus CBS 203.75]